MKFMQNIGPRIILPALCATVFFSISLYFVAGATVRHLVEQNLEGIARSKVTDIAVSESRIASKMLSIASLFSRGEAVQNAYQTAYKGNLSDADDPQMELARSQLRQYFASVEKGYQEIHNGKDLSIHFHVPPARSLLRLWKRGQNQSDDLITFRKTVATIAQGDHRPIKGIEIGRGGFVIRGIAPVFDAAKTYLGSVEMLSSYDPLVNYSASNENEYIAVYMNKEFLPIATKLQDASKYPVLEDKFVSVSSTNSDLTRKILTADFLSKGMRETYMEKSGNYFLTVFPIKDFGGNQIGVMAYLYNGADMFATVKKIQAKIAWLCLILLAVIAVPLFLSIRSVVAPINQTVSMLKDIAEGEGDLTKRLKIIKKDEIGELSGYFNIFLDKLRDIICKIAESTSLLDSAANQFTELFGCLSRNSVDTSGRADSVSTAAEEMSASMKNVAAAMEEVSTNTAVISSAAEEMSATIGQIAENTERGKNTVDQAVEKADQSNAQMEDLKGAAQQIGKVVESITEISEQVNLLALNATIEAARAGEAGKGFAVVANEIKELAGQTSAATLEIKEIIARIQGCTQNTVQGINEINAVIGNVNNIVEAIAAAVQEQSITTREIAGNIAHVSSGIQEINENVTQGSQVAAKISEEINVVNQCAREGNTSCSQVMTSSDDLKQMVGELNIIVGNFKI